MTDLGGFMPGYPCATCRRAANGFALSVPGKQVQQFCCLKCVEGYMRAGQPLDKIEAEAAFIGGGGEGGAYLDSIGKTDLARLTEAEWREFCGRVFRGTCAELQRIADDQVPF